MAERYIEPREQIFLDMMANWKEGMTTAQRIQWVEFSRPWTDAQLTSGSKLCTKDRSRIHPPKGWAEFEKYLPDVKANAAKSRAHYHVDGTWGGDWSQTPRRDLLKAAGMMVSSISKFDSASQARHRGEFLAMCRERDLFDSEIDAAGQAAKDGSLEKWLAEWEAKNEPHQGAA